MSELEVEIRRFRCRECARSLRTMGQAGRWPPPPTVCHACGGLMHLVATEYESCESPWAAAGEVAVMLTATITFGLVFYGALELLHWLMTG